MMTLRTVLELALRGSQPELIDEVFVEGCVVTVKGPGPWLLASAGPTNRVWSALVDAAAPRGSGGRRAEATAGLLLLGAHDSLMQDRPAAN